jgi:hypothetical protein
MNKNTKQGNTMTTGKSWIQVGDKQAEQKTIPTTEPISTPATINVSSGITLNLGNYESLRVDVGITLPCKPTKKDVEDTYAKALQFVEEKLAEQVAEIRASKK